MPSPVRRSARAAPPASVTSSTSSNRQDRNATTTTNNNQKSATPHSLSSEELSEPPRRSKRAQPLVDADVQKPDADEEAIEDEEEVTRCLCGQQEYPGPPLSEAFSSTEAQSEDAGGLFIQCDGCSVWQHGGCVGIVDESQSPDKYYCELCRPKQHEVHTDTNGQRYSLYLPITSKFSTQRKTSMSKGSDDKVKRERADTASRASADPLTGKRRGTIRSREHDEEAEQIQRAIEESAREAQGGKRGGKRSREESSDDLKQENKRQRRASESLPSINRAATLEDESEDEYGDSTTSRVKKARAEAAQVARQAEQREKDKEREKARAEAAGRRQERAGRRRGDDDPDDGNNPTRSGSQSPPASSQPNSPSSFVAPEKTFPQRRAPGKKVKKLGNNQYTKNRVEAAASSPHNRKRLLTSGGTSSGDEQAPHSDMAIPSGTPSAQEGPVNGHVGRGRWGKGKKLNGHAFRHITSEPMEATIPNMARNLEGMMAYIQKSQLDHADDGLRGGGDGSPAEISPGNGSSAMELAEQLTRNIREWQERYRPQDSVRA